MLGYSVMTHLCEDCNTCVGLYVHVGEVIHRQKYLSLNVWDLYPLQSPKENKTYFTIELASARS